MEKIKRKGLIKTGLLLIVLALFPTIEAQTASFDCAKATTAVEKMICTDKELSKLDEDLQKLYSDTHKKDADPYIAKETQKRWIASRNTCKDRVCLAKAYRTRLAALQEKLAESAPCFRLLEHKWPEVGGSSHKSVCVDVLRNLNKLCKKQPDFAWEPSRHLIPIDPSIKTMSLPQWAELDPKEHVELIRYYFQYVDYFRNPEKQLRDVPPIVLKRIKDGRTKLWHTWLDIDRDSQMEHLVLFQYVPEYGTSGSHYLLAVAVADANLTQFDIRYEQLRGMYSIILYEGQAFFIAAPGLAHDAFAIAEGFTVFYGPNDSPDKGGKRNVCEFEELKNNQSKQGANK